MSETAAEKPEQTSSGSDKEAKTNGGRRRIGLILLVLILSGVVTGSWLWYKSKIELVTDDAFVAGHIHLISARVAGHVETVAVADNQPVAAGDLLVELDAAPYRARLDKAQAALAIARNTVGGERAAVAAARAALGQARAQADQAELDLTRGEALFAREVIPGERLDQLRTAAKVARESVNQARQNLARAESQVGAVGDDGQAARIAERAAEVESARLDLAYTRLVAPVAGYVTRKSVEVGSNVQAGQPLLALVRLEEPWIVANYKESQLTHLEPGQKVEFTVDAFPGRTFTGRVDSIMAGTGAAFSLLPPENATGNYVKVVQRIPVKIVIDADTDPGHMLRVGMSVVPTVYTGRSLGDILETLNPFH
ncbi:RND family multidrug resistance efflux pump membrane fusion protein EmrA [Desulfuromonas sp. DDH964]|uniref:HlyD family secretion protein n=1 Tax=Desulfuromonas sp. DDH964 TaxID=1823759 RepID=UPI00078C107C|nr:HlyD family secretion protein [Desulfuromonas sp. DDH964]AMV72947.1 RND family multidrug resistance efflux pump membrane fusion protein EmrA [Desulfuromonas sp. DDH964]